MQRKEDRVSGDTDKQEGLPILLDTHYRRDRSLKIINNVFIITGYSKNFIHNLIITFCK